jgi:hypothetical protein
VRASRTATRTVGFIVPEGIEDPSRVSGGNVYDLRVRDGLAELGWRVEQDEVPPDAAGSALAEAADDAVVLIDGLVAGRSAEALVAESERLRVIVLAHMVSEAFPDADPSVAVGERRALGAARLIVATSEWTRAQLVSRGIATAERIRVATPGTDAAPAAQGTTRGGALLCVGVVAPHKGQDVLIEALARLRGRPDWTCTIAGAIDGETGGGSAFADEVARRAEDAGLGDRVRIAGVLTGLALDAAYRGADLLVAPSRVEAYGIAVADALGRGIPVLASDVGGISEAVASSPGAILVPPGDPVALGTALERWMGDAEFRSELTRAAREGAGARRAWHETAAEVARALEEVAA